MEEKVLIDIEIDEAKINKSIKVVKSARDSIDQLKAVQKTLEEQGKKNSITYLKNEVEIKKLNSTISEQSKILQANQKIQQSAAGSIDQIKANIARLTAEYNALSESQRNNTRVGGKLAQQIKIQNELLNGQKEKLGQSTTFFGRFSQSVSGAVSQNQNLSVAQGALNKVMAANPILLVVTLLGQLFAALQGNQQIMDAIKPVLAAINEGFSVLGDIVIELAGALTSAFKDPIKFIKEMFESLKPLGELLIGILTFDVSKINNGFKELSKNVSVYVDRITEAAKAAYELEQAQIALRTAMMESDEAAARNLVQIEKMKAIAKDPLVNGKDRIAALKEQIRLQDEAFNAQLKNEREALRILEQKAATSTTSEEDLKKISEQRIKVYQLEAELIAKNGDANAQMSGLIRELQAKQTEASKKREEAAKRQLDAELNLEQFGLETAINTAKSVEDRIKAEVELENFKRERLLANDKLLAEERALIIAQSELAISEIITNGEKDRLGKAKEEREKAKAQIDKEFSEALQKHEDYVNSEVNQLKESLLQGIISKQEYEQQLSDIELLGLEMRKGIKEKFGQDDIALEGQIIDAKIKQKEYQTNLEIELEKNKLEAIKTIAGQAAELFNKQSAAYKIAASVQTLISTYQASMEAYKALAGIPVVGPALGAVSAGLVIANGLKRVADINKQQPPKVPKGEHGLMIDVQGKSHAAGGEDVYIGGKRVANIEGQETMVVLNKNARPLLRNLSTINKLTGGIDFMNNRAPMKYLADGGFVARSAASQVSSTNQEALGNQIKTAIKDMKIYTRITELERVQSQSSTARIVSQLGD